MKRYFDGKALGYINAIMFVICFCGVIPRIESDITYMRLYVAAIVIVLQIVCYFLLSKWSKKCEEKLEAGVDRDEQRIPVWDAFAGSLLYSILYSMYAFIFFDIPQLKIFMLVPVAIAIFYRRRGFAHMQTSVQLLIFILSISISPEQVPYHVQDVPAIVHIIFFVVASAQLMIPLVSYDIFKQEALEQKRMIEAREHAQVVFAGNIGEEFDSRLDDIALHCRNIKNNDDNAKVKQNADNIIELCDEIRAAFRMDYS